MPRQDKVTLSEKIIRRTVPVIRLGNAANSVKRYSAALNGSSLIKNGYYAANTLYAKCLTLSSMRKRTYNEQYDTEEEKRVIESSETKMARLHGESIRKDHKGETFDAVSLISIKEL